MISLLKQNAFVLLDLIGADNPVFYNTYRETDDLFQRMQFIGMYFVFQIMLASSCIILYIFHDMLLLE